MKLGESKYTIHAMKLVSQYLAIPQIEVSFCGSLHQWFVDRWDNSNKFYEGSPNLVTCKTCKKLMQKYIVRKLKNEIM